MEYLVIDIEIQGKEQHQLDALLGIIYQLDTEGFQEDHEYILVYFRDGDDNGNSIDALLSYLDSQEFKFTRKNLAEQNWNATWEASFDPVVIAGKCLVRAPFHEISGSFEHELIIEPKMSFGTGHHATTTMMIEALLTAKIENFDVLDMGCGSGILAILAAKMKARSVTAIDVDQWAHENTIENMERNDSRDIIVLKGGVEVVPDQKYHLILANINRNILLEQLPVYKNRLAENGILWLSGIIQQDIELLSSEAIKLGFMLKDKKQINEWVALSFIAANE